MKDVIGSVFVSFVMVFILTISFASAQVTHTADEIHGGIFQPGEYDFSDSKLELTDDSKLIVNTGISPSISGISIADSGIGLHGSGATGVSGISLIDGGAAIRGTAGESAYSGRFTGGKGVMIDGTLKLLNGNLGIGTESPDDIKLHVVSDVSAGGIRIEGSSAPTLYLKNSGSSKQWSMLVEDSTGKFIISDVSSGNNQRFFIDSSGNVGIGVPSTGEKLEVTGKVKADDFCIGEECLDGEWGNSVWTQEADNDIHYNNGNVGIGVTNPGAKLEVAGNIYLSDGAGRTIKVDGVSSGNGYDLSVIGGGTTANAVGGSLILAGGNSGGGGGDVYIYGGNGQGKGDVILAHTGSATQGKVGIGKTDPSEKLDVAGNIKATGTICDSNGCIGSGGGGGDTDWTISENNIYRSSGNVGIGTSTPSEKLEIKGGNIRLDNDREIKMGDTNRIYSSYGTLNLKSTAAESTSYSTGIMLEALRDIRLVTPENIIINSNAVGIGTANPQYKLDVAGNVNLGTAADEVFMPGGATVNNGLLIGSGGLQVTGGDVGIGTASPSEKLEVIGNVKATGTICAGSDCVGDQPSYTFSSYSNSGTMSPSPPFNPTVVNMGTHEFCFLTRVWVTTEGGEGFDCNIERSGSQWTLTRQSFSSGTCGAMCID